METLPITYRDYTIDVADPITQKKYEFVSINYDGPGDNRLGYCDSIEECKSEIDDQIITRLDRENEILENRIKTQAERIAQLEATIAADAKAMTQAHILIGDYKKDVAELESTVANRAATIDILDGFVLNYMKTFEDKFESNEDAFNYEQMKNYVDAASYMARKNGTARYLIRIVLVKMNEMAA